MFSRNPILALLPITLGWADASAQTLTLPAGAAQPGQPFSATVQNDPAVAVIPVHDVPYSVGVGQSKSWFFAMPPSTPPGSYLFVYPHPPEAGAAARLDVIAPDPQFPSMHAMPPAAHTGVSSHVIDDHPQLVSWRIANTASASHTFAAGDEIRILVPGGSTPLAVVPLQGVVVPPGKIVPVSLPLATIGVDVYTVETRWTDPVVGARVVRTGVQPPGPVASTELHLHLGKVVPLGGSLPMRLFTVGTDQAPLYGLLASVTPGSVTMPGGESLPLAPDPMFAASLNTGLFGLVSNPFGVMTAGPPDVVPPTVYSAPSVAVTHPNIGAASGVTLRIAGVVLEPVGNVWSASQAEEIRFE